MGTGYQSPSVTAVAPTVLPISGGSISISGKDFGDGACSNPALVSSVALLLTPPPAPSTLTFNPTTRQWTATPPLAPTLVNCTLLSWSPSLIRCTVPPGLDPNVTLVVSVGGQSTTVAGQLHMEPPAIHAVIPSGAVNTAGGSVVELQGTGFPLPPWPVAVLVGDATCDIQADSRLTATSLRCHTPRGFGRADVTLVSPFQQSQVNASAIVVYSPPMITNVTTPSGRSIEGHFPVSVTGQVR